MKSLFYSITMLLSLGSLAQVNPTNNRISMDVSTYPQNNTVYHYDSCFAVGANLGMGQTGIYQNWTALETAPMSYNFTILDIANYYYPLHNMPLDLTIAPIHTNKLEVPSDLANAAFSSSVMINRFNRLLDSIKVHIPNITLSSLVIGSEHDVNIGSNATLWSQYTIFYNAVNTHAKLLWPGLKVATELTFDGLVNLNSYAQNLNTSSDYIGISYYPLNSNFTVKPVSTIPNDFATLVGLYPSKKLCFYQYGYPSSSVCNSSNALQTQFITQTFTSWDIYANNIKMIDFTWLHDYDVAQVNYWGAYYGLTNPAFLEFLRTLGLRTWNNNGADKPALNELRCQAKLRGFNTLSLNCSLTSLHEFKNENEFNLFPNPANSVIKIESQNSQLHLVVIYDLLGNKIAETSFSNELDVSKINNGIYFLTVYDDNKKINYTEKIIVNHN